MILLGSIVNGIAVILCGVIGSLVKEKLPRHFCDAVVKALSLCIIYIGIDGSMSGENALIAIISIAIGTVLGEWIDIDKYLNRFGMFLQNKINKSGESKIAEGFVSATLLICVGAWAITGAMDAGIRGDHSSFYAKTVIDACSTLIMATTLGIGVALSGIAVFVYQGALTLLSTFIEPYLTQTVINEFTCVGSLLIIGIGLNMLGITKIKVVNMLPSVFIPFILCQFM